MIRCACGALGLLAGLATLFLAVRVAYADSSEACDSNQEVVPTAVGLANPGGPDPDNPDHWEPVGGVPGAPAGFTCATVNCFQTCVALSWSEPTGPDTRDTYTYCECPDTCADPGTDIPEGIHGACKVLTVFSTVRQWDATKEEWVWVVTGSRVQCSSSLNCPAGQNCTFHVTTVGTKKIADCNCQ